MAKVNVQTEPNTITREGKNGLYSKTTQQAVFETPSMKIQIDLEVENDKSGYAIGPYTIDLENQLKPGKYGLELPRYWKLNPAK